MTRSKKKKLKTKKIKKKKNLKKLKKKPITTNNKETYKKL
jgi:hypothetical protein